MSVRTNGPNVTLGWVEFADRIDTSAVLREAADYIAANELPVAHMNFEYTGAGPRLTVWCEDFDPSKFLNTNNTTGEQNGIV